MVLTVSLLRRISISKINIKCKIISRNLTGGGPQVFAPRALGDGGTGPLLHHGLVFWLGIGMCNSLIQLMLRSAPAL